MTAPDCIWINLKAPWDGTVNDKHGIGDLTPYVRADLVDPAAIREAIWSAFIAGCGQGSDEATSFEWGSTAQQTRQQAFDDFMAEWNKDSAPLRALISKGATEPTEYERKVAQMKKDFPNGI